MNARFQVLGYRDFMSKKNQPLTVITVGSDCTEQDNAAGRFGVRVTELFLPDDRVGTLTPECIGQEFIPSYEINGFGRPQLADFTIEPWKK